MRCNASITAESATLPPDPGNTRLSISADRDCTWSARSESAWLQLASTSGQGAATIAVNFSANNAAAARSGAIVVNDQRIQLSQEGRGCTITLSGATDPVPASGGRRSLQIATLQECPWTIATSAPSWLQATVTSGSGPATVAYDVQANSGSAREASLTVGTRSFIVSQLAAPAAPPCTFTIDPAARELPAIGGSGTVSVSAGATCAWSVEGGAPWITGITGSGPGNGTVQYTVAPNLSLASRQATLTIAGRVHTVNQLGVVCSVSLNPTAEAYTSAGGNGVVQVTTSQPICPWTASSNAGWVLLGSGGSTGSAPLTYQVLANTSTAPRTAVISIGGQTLTITQSAAAPPCTYDISPASRTVAAAGETATIALTAGAGCSWTATSDVPWLTLATGSASGTGSATVTYVAAANTTTASRAGTISVGGKVHSVTQPAPAPPPPTCTYTLTPASRSFTQAGGTGTIELATGPTCTWTAVSSAGYVMVTTPAGTGPATITYTVNSAGMGTNRTATITVNGQVHTITQGTP